MGKGVGTPSVIFYEAIVCVSIEVLGNTSRIRDLSDEIIAYQHSIDATRVDPGEDTDVIAIDHMEAGIRSNTTEIRRLYIVNRYYVSILCIFL